MWIQKCERDQRQGVDSPIPTQVVSNEEFIPRPQSRQQRQWEVLIGELADQNSKKLGLTRRDYLRTSMGMATAFLASNMVYGPHWEVDAAETTEPAATTAWAPTTTWSMTTLPMPTSAPSLTTQYRCKAPPCWSQPSVLEPKAMVPPSTKALSPVSPHAPEPAAAPLPGC